MKNKPKYYWDACAWIALIQKEAGRIDSLEYVKDLAEADLAEIWTSQFTLAEVFKRPCWEFPEGQWQQGLTDAEDTVFEDFILQKFVQRIEVTFEVGVLARRLLRRYPRLKKPQDAIHLASALIYNIDELHTFDRPELISLNALIPRRDGRLLTICHPPTRPAPEPAVASAPSQPRVISQESFDFTQTGGSSVADDQQTRVAVPPQPQPGDDHESALNSKK